MKKSFKNTIRIRNAVRVLSLAAFAVLVLMGNVKLWIGVFAAGVVVSFFAGRIYCGWICPMDSMMQAGGKKRFKGIFGGRGGGSAKKKASPGKRGIKLPGWFRIIPLLIFVAAFVGVQRFGIKLSPLIPLTLLSLPFAFLFGERIWHDSICPFGTILSVTSRISEKRVGLRVKPELCTACGACERACPSNIAIESFHNVGGEASSGKVTEVESSEEEKSGVKEEKSGVKEGESVLEAAAPPALAPAATAPSAAAETKTLVGSPAVEAPKGKAKPGIRSILGQNCLQCYSCASVCSTDAIKNIHV